MKRKRNKVFAVIMVGGKGKRLKPLSTDERPKAFLSVTRDRKTMFRNTLDRIRGVVTDDNIIILANKAHAELVKKDFPGIKKENLILETVSRNTAPAIALAAKRIRSGSADGIMAVIPCDQYIKDGRMYLEAIKRGIDFVSANKDAIIMLGIKPKSASTHFGYVRVKPSESGICGIYKVRKFTEKPDIETAREYIKSGEYLWNAGAFIFKASSILKAIEKLEPRISAVLKSAEGVTGNYTKMPDISIDYAVMEKARSIYCVKGLYDWSDVGNFEDLKKVLKREKRSFVEEGGKVVAIQ